MEPVAGRDPFLTYRLLMADPASPKSGASEFGPGVRTQAFAFKRIESLFGDVLINVKYRAACPTQVRE